jgi:hypothetical protein
MASGYSSLIAKYCFIMGVSFGELIDNLIIPQNCMKDWQVQDDQLLRRGPQQKIYGYEQERYLISFSAYIKSLIL